MAVIAQRPGPLDILAVIRGEQLTFWTIHAGDITGDGISASVENNSTTVNFGIVKTYDAGLDETTITYTLTAAQCASLSLGTLEWSMVHTISSIPRTELAGVFEVIEL